MRIAFTTLGCKINQVETEAMRSEALSFGGTVVPFDADADIYVINTCSVTAKSDQQCRQAIRTAVKKGRGAKVVVTGCYAQTRPEELRKIPGVDLIVGNDGKDRMREHLLSLLPARGTGVAEPAPSPAGTPRRERTRGFLKVQDGCNGNCAYCIVPAARGASRSIGTADVERQFGLLRDAGCPEIVLSGIHIGRYGEDLLPRTDLSTLLKDLVARREGARIRVSSIEPREVTGEMAALLGNGLCRHLHIPLQSGDDAILGAMGRNYTSAYYRDLLAGIARQVPDIALGADVMVGFPGEDERAFRNTVRLIEGSPLTHLHVFSYSPRPGTRAAEMRDQVPEPVKKERNELLRGLGKRKNLEFRERLLGKELETVIETAVDPLSGTWTGLTDNYVRVTMRSGRIRERGKLCVISLREVTENDTFGAICS